MTEAKEEEYIYAGVAGERCRFKKLNPGEVLFMKSFTHVTTKLAVAMSWAGAKGYIFVIRLKNCLILENLKQMKDISWIIPNMAFRVIHVQKKKEQGRGNEKTFLELQEWEWGGILKDMSRH